MMLALVVLGAVSGAELSLWLPLFWQRRKPLARLLFVLLLIATAALLVALLDVWTVLVAVISIYRLINLRRIAVNRIQPDYLFYASRQTSLWLIGAQLLAATFGAAGSYYQIQPLVWWYILALVQLSITIVLFASTLRHLRTTKKPSLDKTLPASGLPSLSVAIPARNETTDLEMCLRSLAASTYPKLEILVLDDCSQNKRTPEIIRNFAHNGVQFIAGQQPPEKWLAKNYAYKQLSEAANGEVLLFCGVDTRFQPESLTILVKTMLQKQKTMISILPENLRTPSWNMLSWFIQPSRYAWELALPRRLLRRPPVLSTCWLITREALKAAGGFDAVQRKGIPESYLARATAGNADGYSFLQSDPDIGVTSQKSLEEQKATAIRTRYLQLHRRIELTAFIGLAELTILVWPLIMLAVSLFAGVWPLAALSGLSFVMNTIIYHKMVTLTYRGFTIKGTWLLPVAALYDIGLLNYSMWQYEFGEVLWKGRNVCVPVMRVFPALPKLT